MLTLTGVASALVVIPLLLIFYHLISAGAGALNFAFFTRLPAPVGETGGGMANALLGTAQLVFYAGLIGIPIAVAIGVFMAEMGRTRFGSFVRFVADVMNGIPSIVVGIFVWAWVVVAMGGFSLLAGAIALAVMLIPMGGADHRGDGAPRAEGAPRRRARPRVHALADHFGIVLPAAKSGILTGVLVALARIAGETAPLLFTAFGNPFWEYRLNEPVASLPLLIYQYAISPYDDWHRQAWAASLVLIGLVLVVSVLARSIFKNPYRSR